MVLVSALLGCAPAQPIEVYSPAQPGPDAREEAPAPPRSRPAPAHAVLAASRLWLALALFDDERDRFLAIDIAGTAGCPPEPLLARAEDRALRVFAPLALEAQGFGEEAARLRAAPPITDIESRYRAYEAGTPASKALAALEARDAIMHTALRTFAYAAEKLREARGAPRGMEALHSADEAARVHVPLALDAVGLGQEAGRLRAAYPVHDQATLAESAELVARAQKAFGALNSAHDAAKRAVRGEHAEIMEGPPESIVRLMISIDGALTAGADRGAVVESMFALHEEMVTTAREIAPRAAPRRPGAWPAVRGPSRLRAPVPAGDP